MISVFWTRMHPEKYAVVHITYYICVNVFFGQIIEVYILVNACVFTHYCWDVQGLDAFLPFIWNLICAGDCFVGSVWI